VVQSAVFYEVRTISRRQFDEVIYDPEFTPEEQALLEHYRMTKALALFDQNFQLLAVGNLNLLLVDVNDLTSIDAYVRNHLFDQQAREALRDSACGLM
jgi:hypothetical protein